MKPTFTHKPNRYATADLLIKFAEGKPLSCDQLNFLAWHQRTLSNPHLDPVIKYYLKHYHHNHNEEHSFLLPNNKLDASSIIRFKKRLSLFLQSTPSIELKLKPDEFLQFRALTVNELILYHGNQLLTGAPFHPGGIPQIIFFQWGNTFGVAKYVILAEEKALKSNVLIYFEDLHQRRLDHCVYQYLQSHRDDFHQKFKMQPSMQARDNKIDEQHIVSYRSWFQIPKLTLTPEKPVSENDS